MSDITLTTLESARPDLIEGLLEQELGSWKRELGWDYSPVRRILHAFIQRRALPGFAAVDGRRAVGYTYFLVQAAKGVIGTVYRAGSEVPHDIVDLLQDASADSLQANPAVRRIEVQIMPFHGVELTAAFERRGFECHPRRFLELDSGLEERAAAGQPIDHVASVASFFVSRVDSKIDPKLPDGSDLKGKAAIANAKLAYDLYQNLRGWSLGKTQIQKRARSASTVGEHGHQKFRLLRHALC